MIVVKIIACVTMIVVVSLRVYYLLGSVLLVVILSGETEEVLFILYMGGAVTGHTREWS